MRVAQLTKSTGFEATQVGKHWRQLQVTARCIQCQGTRKWRMCIPQSRLSTYCLSGERHWMRNPYFLHWYPFADFTGMKHQPGMASLWSECVHC
jgi:hypothetical protein